MIVSCFIAICVRAQDKELKIGDRMPNYKFTNIVNYSSSTASFSDFAGKIVILDFWSTGCVACIKSWPKLLELQQQFKDKIQIILVNSYQDSSIVKKIFKRRKELANVNMTLPAICGDTVLGKVLFPHESVPHVVWIDKSGVVTAISFGGDLNKETITKLIAGEAVQLTFKNDFKSINTGIEFYRKPFLPQLETESPSFLKYSILTEKDDKIPLNLSINSSGKGGYWIDCFNFPIKDLYRLAYGKNEYGDTCSLSTLSSSRLFYLNENSTSEVGYEGGYRHVIYQLILKGPTNWMKMQKVMQDDLMATFGYNVSWEKRKLLCLVLSATDTLKVRHDSGKKILRFGQQYDYVLKINRSINSGQLVRILQSQFYDSSPYPIIDETGIRGLLCGIDEENVNLENPVSLDKALEKYGLRFTLQERVLDVLVVK